jgi:predicted DNA-binding ribbon-helix-helix protein
MMSGIAKRSVLLGGHKTSVSVENEFWTALKEIAARERLGLSQLVYQIDSQRQHANLSSAIRLFVLEDCKARRAGGQPVPAPASDENTGAQSRSPVLSDS